ncbi:hypothetical protein K8U54_12990 [Pseudomonas fulva]|uniref:hypothetical protein n=1 Tax=Pseudomonas fulva TaxID=47880 RepID=UPI00201E1413|nr:hypothetical protein [Pseudomonas fulva]UQY32660.1 hypothetical protein K8U54_12990 [Pseudomonas fulva]
MAVLNTRRLQTTIGGLLDSGQLTSAHWSFEWVDQFAPSPFASITERAEVTALTMSWPVEANSKPIATRKMRSWVDDFYFRIHISPSVLDLGNVVSDQSSDIYVWNAWLAPRALAAITGTDEGIIVSGQPVLPLLFPALKELLFELTVTPNGQSVLDTIVQWQFEGGEAAGVHVTAVRIIGWTFVPDWADGITERLIGSTDILQSESAKEQRRSLRQSLRREFEAPMFVEGRERQYLDLALMGWSARTWALPIWHEIQLLGEPVPVKALVVPCETEFLDFHVGGLAMLRGESAFVSETVEIEEVLADGLQLARGTQMAWPAGTRLYPVRSAVLSAEPSLTRLTDIAISADVRFLVTETSDWPAEMPITLYRGYPVFDERPDESEDLTRTLSRLLLTLDNGSAMPLYTDTAERGLAVVGYRWINLGRADRARVRSFITAMNGRQKAVWMPTHSDDLHLVDVITNVATTIDVAYCGYTRFASAAPGRRDIRVELYDGSVFMRRITGSSEISGEIEQLAIDSTFGRQILPDDVFRISWLSLFRFDSDTQEIQHQTDSEGVASWSTVFREVSDES